MGPTSLRTITLLATTFVLIGQPANSQTKAGTPGMYAVLYSPASASKVLPAEINIKGLAAVTKSPVPLLRDTQIGDTGTPYPDRPWARTFTLLKGHTFFAEGANMKIWNATARWGPQGPFMEVRKGVIVQQQFPDVRQIKLVAWGY